MRTLAFRIATWGALLGMFAGLVETTIGSSIRPWIGNKENPFVLGLVTLLLSGFAFLTVRVAQNHATQNADSKLAVILGVLLPAGVCFTTVGALWYLPGMMLFMSAALLIAIFWRERPRTAVHPWRWISGMAALIGLLSFLAALWRDTFGLVTEILLVGADRLMIQILPMDIVRRTVSASGAGHVEVYESSTVMLVYLLIVLGVSVSLLASLASSRLFAKIGGGISLAGNIFFLWQLPTILLQANFQSASPLWTSLRFGWYLSMLGTVLILLGAFWQEWKPGKLLNFHSLPGEKLS